MSESDFKQRVKELIHNDEDKEKLFSSLRTYQSNHDLQKLLSDLQILLNEPSKLELYDYMRPLILLQHQLEYSRRTPSAPGIKLRTVRLFRHPGESLGFAVRGGYEHGVGIFVTEVTPGSQAERQGLRVGDEVVRVNGFTIAEAVHEDVLNLIKSREEIVLKVTYIGMLPVKNEPGDPVTWQYVTSLDEDIDDESSRRKRPSPDLKIFIDSTGHASLGCSILSESGPGASVSGIFIEKVRPGSIGDQVGLEPGDQIMEVNETSFRKITWEQAVLALKSSRQLNVVIRKNVGSKLIQKWSSNLSAKGNSRQNNVTSQIPASPLGLSDIEPVYSTVNKVHHSQEHEIVDRRTSASKIQDELSEVELIEQELNRSHIPHLPSSLPQHNKPPAPSQLEMPPSPTYSNKSSASSLISTAAEVHTTSYNSTTGDVDGGAPRSSFIEKPMYPQKSALGGAAALIAERKLNNNTSNTPDLLGPPDEYEWNDNVRGQIYNMFSSSILDGRRLLCLTYNKNADLGIDVEGGLGSPLGGKILVAVIFDGGIARKSGKMHVGDQLMMINGQMLLGITAAEAERIIQGAANSAKDKIELFYCESTLVNDESSSTYF